MTMFNTKTVCINANLICNSFLSLPMYPEVSIKNIEVIDTLSNNFVD